jgi:hypothetical protein
MDEFGILMVPMGIILKRMFRKWDGDMDLIDFAQNRERRRALVNGVMNLWVLENAENILTVEQLLSLNTDLFFPSPKHFNKWKRFVVGKCSLFL